MKNHKYFLLSICTVLIFACTPKQEDSANKGISADIVKNPISATDLDTTGKKMPKIVFEEATFDFGKIKQGEKVSHAFKFKNTGQSDLIISSASGSCGCTVPEYPKKPIKPNEEGVVNVIFNSEGKSGKQNKSITVVVNAIPNTMSVSITGEVITE